MNYLLREVLDAQTVLSMPDNKAEGWSRNRVFLVDESSRATQNAGFYLCFFAENESCSIFILLEKRRFEFMVKIALRDKVIKGTVSDCFIKNLLFAKSGEYDIWADYLCVNEKNICITVDSRGENTVIDCEFLNFAGYGDLSLDLCLKEQKSDMLNVFTSVDEKPGKFYLKELFPDVTATGVIRLDNEEYQFDNNLGYSYKTCCSLPYRQIYRYVTVNCKTGGKNFSLYLGSRIGDSVKGAENCYFHGGEIKKLSKIKFIGSEERIDKIWNYKGGINAVDLIFKPDFYRDAPVFAKCDKTTIVYGKLHGEFNLINCEKVRVDALPAQMVFTVI